ncbi:MAG: DUF6498-containing protein [Candidatus Nomurabacteria bacterium]|jgi:hypothetical protein|nr:DUF6498-containing protein [Candidatus Nomurabacteria bacterium]
MSIVSYRPLTAERRTLGWQTLFFAAIPILGMLFLGWDWREILLLYWLENISLGVITVIKLLTAPLNGSGTSTIHRIVTVIFFMIHYGVFCMAHGILVVRLISGEMDGLVEAPTTKFAVAPVIVLWLLALGWRIVATVAKIVALKQNNLAATVWPNENIESTTSLFLAPYARIVPLHVAVIFGLGLSNMILPELPSVAAILLIILHVCFDLKQAKPPRKSTLISSSGAAGYNHR